MNVWDIAKTENRYVKNQADATQVVNKIVRLAQSKHRVTLDRTLVDSLVLHTLFLKEWDERIKYKPNPLDIVKTYIKRNNIASVLDGFKKGCIGRHPVLCELMAIILENKWVEDHYDEKTFKVVKNTVHMMLIFDALVKHTVSDSHFLVCLMDYYSFMKWRKYKTNNELLGRDKESLFAVIKAESVDWCLTQFLQMKDVRDSKSFNKTQRAEMFRLIGKRCAFGLDTNIYEAIVGDKIINTEYSRNNATAGTNGLLLQPYGIPSLENSQMVFNQMRQSYASHYLAWNLCFICKYTSAPMLYAKLFQPYVLDAEPKDFMFRRAISLLLTVQSVMCNIFYRNSYRDSYDVSKLHVPFSELNLKYGNAIMVHYHGTSSHWHKFKLFWHHLPHLASKLTALFRSKPLAHMNSRKPYRRRRSSSLYKELTWKTLKRPYRQVKSRSRSRSRRRSASSSASSAHSTHASAP